jgi:superfamily II DNA or RNA helicase/HKD family nuclease
VTLRLVPGLYETLVTRELQEAIAELGDGVVDLQPADPGDAHRAVAEHVRRLVERALRSLPEATRLAAQAELCNELMASIRGVPEGAAPESAEELVSPLSILREVREPGRLNAAALAVRRPLVPLDSADLLVNARDQPSVGAAIEREIHSADGIDLLCAFVRWSGLRTVRPALEAFRQAGRPLRVITTVYTGSTERKALDWLVSIGASVKVSYDTRTTRLHAKAWLFERESGYSTAFIGSSNLTHSSLLDGVEWNVRLAQASTPDLLDKFKAAFDSYWADPDYESYDPTRDAEKFDRAVRSTSQAVGSPVVHFDLHPYPFQREMLQALTVERERHGRFHNLVVAATGTGKTMVAAFDYLQIRKFIPNPSLLFVAHRKEILAQSLAAYRAVLKDYQFGQLLVDGQKPTDDRHVFASVQMLSQMPLGDITPEAYDVVVIDEFHRAAAPTYERLLNHLKPRVLLGLTATPERTDSRSLLGWFDNRIAVELRLWDALERGLLCPFQYFGISDGVDLSGVQWAHGGYVQADLEKVYTGDQRRVDLVVAAIVDKLVDPRAMRAFGFCVSVAHAEFMAREFTRRGIPSVAVSGDSASDDREAALRHLRDKTVNVVFCVDLFNEGVDVPEVDTVLFLRPTESALVFLQQLGRGLRRLDDKPCLTVLDFVGQAHRKFRFDLRLRALIGGHRSDLIRQVEEGFPTLPSGCSIQLDRVVTDVVLANIRQSVGSTFASLVAELVAVATQWRDSGRNPNDITLGDFLGKSALTTSDLYRTAGWSWSALRRDAGLVVEPEGPEEDRLRRAMGRLLHVDEPARLDLYRRAGLGELTDRELDESTPEGRILVGLHYGLWGANDASTSLRASMGRLREHPEMARELADLMRVLDDRAAHAPHPLDQVMDWRHKVPLGVHGRASRDEILAAFGRLSFAKRSSIREGVYFDRETNTDLFFVTLEKTEGHYSPSTMYRDYAISPELFHWESQSQTSVDSETGQRYLSQRTRNTNVILFVRHRKHEEGRTAAYTCLGPADYVSHKGSRPVEITWQLRYAMPDDFFRGARVAAG